MRTVGRDRERSAIARLISARTEGALLLVGERGSGKSHLLQQAAATSPIATVLLRTTRAESRWPLSGLLSLLTLITNDRQAAQAAIGPRFANDPRRASAVASEVRAFVQRLGLSPTLVLIDDLHRMDRESQVVVGSILSRLEGTGLRVVVTLTTDRPMALPDHLPRVSLRPLERHDIVAIALDATPDDIADSPVLVLAGYADGNPGLMLELVDRLDAVERSGAAPLRLPPWAGPLADRLGAARLERLPAPSRQLVDAIASAPLTRRGSLTRGDADLDDALQELLAAGIVEQRGHDVRIRDGAVRAHLEHNGSAAAMRERHRYEDAADAADARTRPWHRSFLVPDPAIALRLLDVAAIVVRDGVLVAGIEFAERARVITEGEPFGTDGFIQLASRLFDAGEIVLAERYLDVARLTATTESAETRLAYLRQKVEFVRHGRVLDLDVRLPAWIAADPEHAVKLLAFAAIAHALRFEVTAAQEKLQRLAQMNEGRREPHLTRAARLVRTIAGQPADPAEAWVTADPAPADLIVAARTALVVGDVARARSLCRAVLDRRPLTPMWSTFAEHTLVETEIRDGRLAHAHRLAVLFGQATSATDRRSSPTVLDAWIAVTEDRVEDAIATIEGLLDISLHDNSPADAASLHVLRGQLALLGDDPDHAMSSLGKAEAIDRNLQNPGLVRHLPDLVEAAVLTGRRTEIEAAVQRFERRVDHVPSRWGRLALMRIRATLAAPESSAVLFDELVEAWTAGDSPLELGRVHLLRADRLQRCGQDLAARGALAAACDAFDEAGALAWSREAHRRLVAAESIIEAAEAGRLIGAALSAEEQDIVEAIRRGLSTKEIASLLHFSVRAVELRLTSIYRAAGVESRSQLIERLTSP